MIRRLAALPSLVLVVIGILDLWVTPPAGVEAWQLVAYPIFGAGVGTAGYVASAVARPGVWGPLLGAGTVLPAAQVLAVAGASRWSDVLATLAVGLLLPAGVLRVPARTSRASVQTALDVVVLVLGLATVAAVAVGVDRTAAGLGLATGCVVFCMVWLQFELSSGDGRRQVLWVVLGGVIAAMLTLFVLIVGDNPAVSATAVGVLIGVLSLPLPVAVAIAAVDPRVADVRRAISHTSVFAVMFALVLGSFGGIYSGILVLNDDEPPVVGATALLVVLIAAAYHPVLVRVRVTMDTLLFGGRADPVDTLTRLGSQFSAGSEPQDWLDSLRGAVAVPGIELRALAGGTVATSGAVDGGETSTLPLRAGGEHVGDLVVSLPAEQLRLPPATRAVLELVSGPLAQALRAIRLADDLQVSRSRAVAALEEERRRLRRDLHDGLGPTLTGIAYSADAAANLVRPDPGQAESLLRELRSDTADAIAEIRRIVEGLRPRAIDEFGVVEAVRRQVSRLRASDGRPLEVSIDAPALPDLPAAVEVVAYRVVVEAVTNVARHSGVDAARVGFVVRGDVLELQVDDGGRGGPWTPGVGLASMRERVEQVGGTLEAAGEPSGGRVRARLPLTLSN